MRASSRFIPLGFAFGGFLAFACGAYSGDDPETIPPPPTTSTQDASSVFDAEVPSIPTPSSDGPCNPDEVPDTLGIFVSSARGNDENAGTAVSPVSSLARALGLAKGDAPREIYVAQGIYEAPSPLTVETRDLRVSGGWKEDPVRWTRDCSAGRRAKTVLYVGGSPALTDKLDTAAGRVVIEGLSIAMVRNASATASAYAVFLKDTGPEWNLSDVTLVADRGADGGNTAPAPGPARSCTPCGAAVTPKVGAAGQAVAPSFTKDGYVLGTGTAGEPGSAGQPGSAPPAPPTAQAFAGGCSDKTEPNCGSKTPTETVRGNPGSCGCGGSGGAGGGGGEGGGASVALFVSGTRVVRASYTHMKTLGGGNGSAGNAGAPGGAGTAGAAGAPRTYDARRCEGQSGGGDNEPCKSEPPVSKPLAGGGPGGNGGTGAAGGPGGPGAGGASVGLVRIGAVVELGEGIMFEVGSAGAGAEGAEAGQRVEQLEL